LINEKILVDDKILRNTKVTIIYARASTRNKNHERFHPENDV